MILNLRLPLNIIQFFTCFITDDIFLDRLHCTHSSTGSPHYIFDVFMICRQTVRQLIYTLIDLCTLCIKYLCIAVR
ncbi:hypothetical protein AN217_06375 [Streptomyces qinglanensis]|uniref:Uncharacterized protein n=1 Tax=Streptomyces qinglanensis TaxID=943816 RepID=A0A1E7K0T5_9ACTN|nr:hypothetical protein AN217_06375 [Streptomyces qinglanensis]OEV25597.1 hypothetical protein AN220_12950 [Streptomyces nanshensis]